MKQFARSAVLAFVLSLLVSVGCGIGERPVFLSSISGCSFVQQTNDIVLLGDSYKQPKRLTSQGEDMGVDIYNKKGEWLLGVDAQDVTVIINRSTGEVISHGTRHADQESSSLPEKLLLPISISD